MRKPEYYAIACALCACLIWSGNFIVARGVHDWIPPFGLAFWRWLIACLVILPFSYRHIRREWPIIRQHKRYLLLMGVCGIGAFNTLIYIGAHSTSAHHIALILCTAPVGTLLIVGLMGLEKLSRYKVVGAFCALAGALTVVTHGEVATLLELAWNRGDLWLVAATVVWACWNAAVRRKPQGLSARAFLTVQMAIGVAALLPFYLVETLAYGIATPFAPQAWLIYLYVGVGASVIAWGLWQYSVETIGSIKTTLIYYTMPVFSGILAVLILHEPLEPYHVAGFVLVVVGIVLSNLRRG